MEAADLGAAAAARRRTALVGSTALRYLTTPFLLGLVLVGLAVYLNPGDWDTVEQQNLNLDVVRTAVGVQLKLVAISTAIVLAIAIPLGILLTRHFARRIEPPVLALASVGQAVPSLGVLAVFAVLFGIGIEGVIFALVVYSLLAVLRNTMVGIEQVDPALIEAARGMGMSRLGVLRRIELPLAVPVMLAGIRTALIINVGSATLAAFTLGAGGGGDNGLGELINSGLRLGRLDTVVLTGAVLTAVLALLLDWVAGIVEDWLRPKGLQ